VRIANGTTNVVLRAIDTDEDLLSYIIIRHGTGAGNDYEAFLVEAGGASIDPTSPTDSDAVYDATPSTADSTDDLSLLAGSGVDTVTNAFDGALCELFYADVRATDAQVLALGTYFAERWGF